LQTLPGLVATARLADCTLSEAAVVAPWALAAVAESVVVLEAGEIVASSGAWAGIVTFPLASATALPNVVPPVSCTVLPGSKPPPVITIGAPGAGSALTSPALPPGTPAAGAGAAGPPPAGTAQHAVMAMVATR